MDGPNEEDSDSSRNKPHQVNNDSPFHPTSTSVIPGIVINPSPNRQSLLGCAPTPEADLVITPHGELKEAKPGLSTENSSELLQNEKYQADSQIATWSCDASKEGDLGDRADVRSHPRRPFFRKPTLPNFNLSLKWSKEKILRNSGLWYRKHVIQGILRRKEMLPTKDGRHIELDISRKFPLIDERTGKPHIDNSIRSSRYTIWTFLPYQLWFQFSKPANFYFLIIGSAQMVPGLSTTGTYTTFLPVVFFLVLTIAREGYDDFRRYQLDKLDNRRPARALRALGSGGISVSRNSPFSAGKEHWNCLRRDDSIPARKDLAGVTPVVVSGDEEHVHKPTVEDSADLDATWTTVKWKDIKVGDVIELNRNDPIPADIVLLYTDGRDGIAYIETMALDGETNLKSRRHPGLLSCETLVDISKCRASFTVEDPNLNLYEFFGRVTLNGKTSPVTLDNIVYRGSTLRNTIRAIGLVINTGEECKIRMNASKNPRAKAPAIQFITNRVVLVLVAFVLLLAVGCTAGYEIWTIIFESRAWYLAGAHLGPAEIFIAFVIEFNNLIPLALYISLELVKFAQFLLLHDVEMYDEVSNTPMVSNTQNIYENLGQVSYIFSDKTGTLTDNVMRFRKISVAGRALLHGVVVPMEKKEQDFQRGNRTTMLRSISHDGVGSTPIVAEHKPTAIVRSSTDGLSFPAGRRSLNVPTLERYASQRNANRNSSAKEFLQSLWRHPDPDLTKKVRFFLLSLALCHTCFPETRGNGQTGFQAASPDELALVEAAAELGYIVTDRTTHLITLSITPPESESSLQEVYEILDVVEFTSKRKRMSIIVRFPDGRICIFCKGADSVILPRLRHSSLALLKASEVRERHQLRKSFEVEEAIIRKSNDDEIRRSFTRSSLHLERPSMNIKRMAPQRSSITLDEFSPSSRQRDAQRRSVTLDECSPVSRRRQRDEIEGGNGLRKSAQIDRRFLSLPSSEPNSPITRNDSDSSDDGFIFERCLEHIDEFASEGLRTLMFGYRFIMEDEYTGWSKVYHEATTSLADRQELIESAAEIIEKNFELSGATGIEDKLQNGVPETIEKLQKANIKIWMLTGDKRETAINIAHSARICKTYSEIIILDHQKGDLKEQINSAFLKVTEGRVPHSVVVIDGQTLMGVENDITVSAHFYDFLLRVDSVICCRASPFQKASMVKSIRHKVPDSITLAIGDGGNDIAMIQEAHVGVGISGKEGLQAARVADYSIAQFRFLQRLLLVHGHWNYIRTSKYILTTFWKEMLFYCIQVLYQKWNGYTGTSLFESWSLTFWNLFFTSLCVMLPGIFEQDISATTLLAVPEIYIYGQKCRAFNLQKCGIWMLIAAIQSLIIYFMIYYLYGVISFTTDQGLFAIGDMAFSVCVIIINVKLLLLDYYHKTWIPIFGFVLTIAGWWAWNLLLSGIYANTPGPYSPYQGFMHIFGRNPTWWATQIVVVWTLVVFELGVSAVRRRFWPSVVDLWQEIENEGKLGMEAGRNGDEGEEEVGSVGGE
ncbi:hypothetical protein G7Y89_g6786 [Cudoniella acicularis]|uniref:Phospholipid-transporting ATPase n=1 Tax=Cudoniella acicularis TaxID=354080 RepID=A0A8H4RJR4_9HELO|nr:hypothetical protein G7Y89_g6786 [Cudoniella acicularis]